MKTKGKNRNVVEDPEQTESRPRSTKSEAPRNFDGTGKVKWYHFINFREMLPHMPVLRNYRGGKSKVQFTTFCEVDASAQSIYERNKNFFRTRAQVDIAMHYIGCRIFEFLYLLDRGFTQNKLSKELERYEERYQVYDDMKMIREKVKDDAQHYAADIVTKDEINERIARLLAVLERPDDRERMARIIAKIMREADRQKAADKFKLDGDQNDRIYEAMAKGMKTIDGGRREFDP